MDSCPNLKRKMLMHLTCDSFYSTYISVVDKKLVVYEGGFTFNIMVDDPFPPSPQ